MVGYCQSSMIGIGWGFTETEFGVKVIEIISTSTATKTCLHKHMHNNVSNKQSLSLLNSQIVYFKKGDLKSVCFRFLHWCERNEVFFKID